MALRLKPEKFPIADGVVGTGGGYTFEFYGVETIANNVINEFTLTNTAYTDWLAVKVLYAGANRTNFTGSLLQSSDVKISSVRWWQSYLDNDTIKTHAYDASNFGVKNPYRSDSMFQNLDADATPDNPNIHVPQIETLALHWDFATITTSDASGDFEVPDASSGSAALATRYGPWMGRLLSTNILRGVQNFQPTTQRLWIRTSYIRPSNDNQRSYTLLTWSL